MRCHPQPLPIEGSSKNSVRGVFDRADHDSCTQEQVVSQKIIGGVGGKIKPRINDDSASEHRRPIGGFGEHGKNVDVDTRDGKRGCVDTNHSVRVMRDEIHAIRVRRIVDGSREGTIRANRHTCRVRNRKHLTCDCVDA